MNKTLQLINYMQDWEFHSNVELSNVAGWRFGGRLFNLRKQWFVFEKKQWEWYIEYWKLVKSPNFRIVNKDNTIC